MKQKILLLILFVCGVCSVLPVNAAGWLRYTRYGGCELITRYSSTLLNRKTTYGLARQGREVLAPVCEMWYNEEIHMFAFRYKEGLKSGYRLMLFDADNGKCLYSAHLFKSDASSSKPQITFEQEGEYTKAILHGYGVEGAVIGSYFRKNGKLYQRLFPQASCVMSVQ